MMSVLTKASSSRLHAPVERWIMWLGWCPVISVFFRVGSAGAERLPEEGHIHSPAMRKHLGAWILFPRGKGSERGIKY